MMKKKAFTLLLLMAFMAAGVQTAVAQNSDSRDYNRGWYAGLSGGAGGFGGAASNIGTGVAAARAAAGLAAKYYDLQGRRLSQPSRAGVY